MVCVIVSADCNICSVRCRLRILTRTEESVYLKQYKICVDIQQVLLHIVYEYVPCDFAYAIGITCHLLQICVATYFIDSNTSYQILLLI